MARVNIIKAGIKNVVEESIFEKLYKPNGWRINESIDSSEKNSDVPLKLLHTETEVKNYIKMTNKQPKHFDDGLFFSDIQN